MQAKILSSLNGRQVRSLHALQRKVDNHRSFSNFVAVTDAQHRAMQAAYDAAKRNGIEIPPEAKVAAMQLGLV